MTPIFHTMEPTKPDRTRKLKKTRTRTRTEVEIRIRIRITNEEVVPSHMPPHLGRLMHTPPPSLGRPERGLDGAQVPVQTGSSFPSVARRSKWSNFHGSSPLPPARLVPNPLISWPRGPPLELQDPPVCGNYSFVVGKLQYEKEQELQWNGSSHSRDNSEAISTTRRAVSFSL